jgi:protein-S-isoprenylcysteine O-methyltransferase Ste14
LTLSEFLTSILPISAPQILNSCEYLDVNDLNKRAFSGLFRFLLSLALCLFLPAWTFRYWQAWLFLAVFSASVFAITFYLMNKDPELLGRRLEAGPAAEKEHSQQLIQFFAALAFLAVIILPAIDHRFSWSAPPLFAVLAGDGLVALGLLFIFFVFKENTYTSGVIEVDAEQKVVSTGPYALVRHPMYVGAIIMLVGIPLALGSWFGLLAVIPITFVIVLRLLDEERFLARNLPGYPEYQRNVRYRLVPFVW